jgi:hypothetical protein
MQPLQARFASQDDAESAIRKLASLRSDCFRLELVSTAGGVTNAADSDSMVSSSVEGLTSSIGVGSAFQSSSGDIASADVATPQRGVSSQEGYTAEFTLSANVPDEAAEQARKVISQAGGQVV